MTTNTTSDTTVENEEKSKPKHHSVIKTIKRKEHPSEVKYPGYSCVEVDDAWTSFVFSMEDPEHLTTALSEHFYPPMADKAKTFFDEIKVGDVIGCVTRETMSNRTFSLGARTTNGMLGQKTLIASKWKVVSINDDERVVHCERWYNPDKDTKNKYLMANLNNAQQEQDISENDLTVALALDLAEVIRRDDVWFGVSEEKQVQFNILNVAAVDDEAATGENVEQDDK